MMDRVRKTILLLGVCIAIAGICAGVFLESVLAFPVQEGAPSVDAKETSGGGTDWGDVFLAISAAMVTSAGCFGAAYAVARVGSAAMGAASEKPELLGRSLLFVGLAEGIAIYGLIVGIMLLMKIV